MWHSSGNAKEEGAVAMARPRQARARRRGTRLVWLAILGTMVLGLTACSAEFSVPAVQVDLAPLGANSGKVVVAPAKVNDAMFLDGTITATGTSRTLTVRTFMLDGPDPTAAGCTAATSAPTTYLCDPTTQGFVDMGTFTLAPGETQPFSWTIRVSEMQVWLGVELVGTAASSATVTFAAMTGTIPGN